MNLSINKDGNYSIRETAKLLGMSARHVQYMIAVGWLTATKNGRSTRVLGKSIISAAKMNYPSPRLEYERQRREGMLPRYKNGASALEVNRERRRDRSSRFVWRMKPEDAAIFSKKLVRADVTPVDPPPVEDAGGSDVIH